MKLTDIFKIELDNNTDSEMDEEVIDFNHMELMDILHKIHTCLKIIAFYVLIKIIIGGIKLLTSLYLGSKLFDLFSVF